MVSALMLWDLWAGTAQEAVVSTRLGRFPRSHQSPLAGGREVGPEGQLSGDPGQVRPLHQGEHWPAEFLEQDRLQEPEPHLE